MDGSMKEDEDIDALAKTGPNDDAEGLSSKTTDDDLMLSAKRWWPRDTEHSRAWREDAVDDYAFVAGDQISEEDKEKLRDEMRPYVSFNRIGPVVNAVSGLEIQNRQEVRYIPRTQGDVQVNELLTSAAIFMRDECDAEDEDTDAFLDTVICGMGWSESRLDFEEDPEGSYVSERRDPIEMAWDCGARKRNLADSRRFWHVKEYALDEAQEMFPGFEAHQLHASWASDLEDNEEEPHNADKRIAYLQDDAGKIDPGKKVRIVHLQWCEKEHYGHRIADPFTGQQADLSVEDFKALSPKLSMLGMKLKDVKLYRKKWFHAFLGSEVLKRGENLCPEHSSFECITGQRDRNKGTWYGVVRMMKDPQRWANKWLSQALHILNVNAKGGLMAERGAFENDREAEETWANPSKITWVNPGAIGAQRVKEKTAPAMPQGPEKFLELAISSIRDVSGVNLELLGLRDANQAGVLEAQRKQAGMTILAHLFDNLRRYRKRTGRTLLYYITNYLSDGRLVRIVGEEQEQYVPLLRQTPDVTKFDVIVDDAPTSPNQKEMVWGSLMQLMPMIQNSLPPQALLALAKYSPLPSKVVEELGQAIEEASQGAAQAQQAAQQAEMARLQGELADKQAGSGLKQAQTQKTMAEAQKVAVETQIAAVTPIAVPTVNIGI